MKPNAVPWAASVLYEATPLIVQAFGEGFVPAGGQLYPSGPEQYGIGGFSAVFPCVQDGLVMKVTVDGSEAFLCEVLRKLGPMPGLPRYEAEPIKLERDGEPVWIVWRQDLPGPTLDAATMSAWHEVSERYDFETRIWHGPKSGREVAKVERERAYNKYGLTDERDLKEAQQCGLCVSSLFASLRKRGVAEAQRILSARLSWANQVFFPRYDGGWEGWRFMKKGEDELETSDRAALSLLGYEMLLGRLAVGTLVPDMAQSLLRLLEEGVIVCDVNPDNVSAAVSPPTLFDGGFTLPLHPRWNSLWERVGPRIERWWDHNQRMDAHLVWMGRPKGQRWA